MAQPKPPYLNIYLNLVNHVELLTDKLQQDLEARLKRLDQRKPAPTEKEPAPVNVPAPTPVTPTPAVDDTPPPVDTHDPSKTGTVHGTEVPTSAVTQSGKPWWTKLPAWRGIRGIFRWFWYGHHRDNPDYAPYIKDWVDTFSKDRLKLVEYASMQDKAEDIAEQFTKAICQEFIEASLADMPDLKNLIDGFKSAVCKAVFNAIKQVYELGKGSGGTAAPTPITPPEAEKTDGSKPKPVVPTPKDEPAADDATSRLQPALSPQTDADLPGPSPKRTRKKKMVVPPAGEEVTPTTPATPVAEKPPAPEGEDVGRELPTPTTPDDSAAVLYGTRKLSDEELEGMKLSWDQRADMLKTIESKMSGSKKTPLQQRRHKEWKDGKAGKEKAYQYLKSKSLVPEAPDDLKNIWANARLRNYIGTIFHVTPKAADLLMAYIKTREKKSDLPIGGQTSKSEKEVDAEVDDILNRLESHDVWSNFNRNLYEEMTPEEKKNYLLELLRKGKQDTFIPKLKVDSLPWTEKIAFYKKLLRA